ncbi:hypothetical protein MHYP_G00253010 [Metynnis hypsauchen]
MWKTSNYAFHFCEVLKIITADVLIFHYFGICGPSYTFQCSVPKPEDHLLCTLPNPLTASLLLILSAVNASNCTCCQRTRTDLNSAWAQPSVPLGFSCLAKRLVLCSKCSYRCDEALF